MKRKLSVGLILVLVILSLSVTAVAAAIMNHVFEQVIDMEVENGPFYTWSYEDRLRLVDLLAESGWVFPEDQLQELHDEAISISHKEAIVTSLVTEAFGREDALSHITIIESVKGPMTTWSLEDKAWYTQYLRSKLDLLDSWQDLLPEEGDLTIEEAVSIAKQAILQAYEKESLQVTIDYLNEELQKMMTDVSFFITDDEAEPRWMINFLPDPYSNAEYSVLLTRDGQVTEDAKLFIYTPEHAAAQQAEESAAVTYELHTDDKGRPETWSLEDKATLLGDENGLPTAGDISEAEAVRIADESITNLGVDPSQYTMCVWYKLYDPYDSAMQKPFYAIYFIDDLDAPFDSYAVIIDAQSGTVLKTISSDTDSNG